MGGILCLALAIIAVISFSGDARRVGEQAISRKSTLGRELAPMYQHRPLMRKIHHHQPDYFRPSAPPSVVKPTDGQGLGGRAPIVTSSPSDGREVRQMLHFRRHKPSRSTFGRASVLDDLLRLNVASEAIVQVLDNIRNSGDAGVEGRSGLDSRASDGLLPSPPRGAASPEPPGYDFKG